MKVVILAGGQGTRLSEVTTLVPKPMVKIGNMPILFHIIKIFCKFGHTDYYIATGYKSQIVKNFFKFKSKTYKIINKSHSLAVWIHKKARSLLPPPMSVYFIASITRPSGASGMTRTSPSLWSINPEAFFRAVSKFRVSIISLYLAAPYRGLRHHLCR